MKTISINKKVFFNYFVIKEFEAGIILKGWEIKNIKNGLVNITNSYISIINNELFILNLLVNIKNNKLNINNDLNRNKKILLNKKEINYLIKFIKKKGYTIVVLSLYIKNKLCKAQIALVKGKSLYDKRKDLKNKEWIRNKQIIYKNKILDLK